MYQEIENIVDIRDIGTVFQREWEKVKADIADPGTQFESKREIQIKIEVAPIDKEQVAINVTGITKCGKPIDRAFLALIKKKGNELRIVQQMVLPFPGKNVEGREG